MKASTTFLPMERQPGSPSGMILQRAAVRQSVPGLAPPIVREVLRSSGHPLDEKTRGLMESRFGQDFSRVRIHTDAKAAHSAQAVNALAYTVGSHVVFGDGHYTPEKPNGQRLLAHELTHTLQQNSSTDTVPPAISIGPKDGLYEQQAEQASIQNPPVPSPGTGTTSSLPAGMLQRQTAEEERGRNIGPAVEELPRPPICSFVWSEGRPYWKCENLPSIGSTPNIPLNPADIPDEVRRRLGSFGQRPGGQTTPWMPNIRTPDFDMQGDFLREHCRRFPTLCAPPGAATGAPSLGPMLPIPDVNLGPASALGASMMGSLTLDNFILNSAVLSDDHNRILDEHATRLLDLLRQYPNSFISISGHTDATGREDRNQPLSRERAETVKQALIARGIPGEIITSSGLGASVLRVDTSQADPRNRRVEIHFTARNLFNLQTRQ